MSTDMRLAFCLVSSIALLVSGCHRTSDAISRFAESTRAATEQLASDSDQSNARREIQIDPDVGALRHPPPIRLTERYETREGPDGYFIYDTEEHSVARIGNQNQAGLSYDQARAAFDALSTEDIKHSAQ